MPKDHRELFLIITECISLYSNPLKQRSENEVLKKETDNYQFPETRRVLQFGYLCNPPFDGIGLHGLVICATRTRTNRN